MTEKSRPDVKYFRYMGVAVTVTDGERIRVLRTPHGRLARAECSQRNTLAHLAPLPKPLRAVVREETRRERLYRKLAPGKPKIELPPGVHA